MSTPLVTYEDAKSTIGTLPSLEPRPNSTNLRTLTIDLTDKLTTIRPHQSAAFGYAGIVDEADVYAMKTTTAWQDWTDPGPHQPRGLLIQPFLNYSPSMVRIFLTCFGGMHMWVHQTQIFSRKLEVQWKISSLKSLPTVYGSMQLLKYQIQSFSRKWLITLFELTTWNHSMSKIAQTLCGPMQL